MPIYADPTELRDVSNLPSVLIATVHSLPGLESTTGADLLITPHDAPLERASGSGAARLKLAYHIDSGCLVQRKSGGDLLSSIDKLPEILARMREWQGSPWLLVTGVSRGVGDSVKVAGSRRHTRWRWSSVRGALDSWQDRGGCVEMLACDDEMTEWVASREAACIKWLEKPERTTVHETKWVTPKRARQSVRLLEEGWFSTGRAWPKGIGTSQLAALGRYIVQEMKRPPTLANAIGLAVSEEVLQVPGWGKKSRDSVRAWYGCTNSTLPALDSTAPSFCLIYDWHEGMLVDDEGELKRIERVELNP